MTPSHGLLGLMDELCKHEITGCELCSPTQSVRTGTIHLSGRRTSSNRRDSIERWSDKEHEIAADKTLTDEQVAELTGRTLRSVGSYRVKHHLRDFVPRVREDSARTGKAWDREEIVYVQEHPTETARVLAERLGRSRRSIEHLRHHLRDGTLGV